MGVKENKAFPATLDENQLLTDDTVLGVIGGFVPIGEGYEIPAGTALMFGQGKIRGQDAAVGRIYIDMQDDTPGNEEGTVRLLVEDPAGTEKVEIGRWSTERLRSGDADTLAAQLTFPADGRWFPPHSTVIIEMAPDVADDTIDVSECVILMDVMRAPFTGGV